MQCSLLQQLRGPLPEHGVADLWWKRKRFDARGAIEIAHVERIVAAEQHVIRSDRIDEELKRARRMHDGVVVESAQRTSGAPFRRAFGSARTLKAWMKRPAWYGTKPPP
jgi:hypothetical protein